MHSVAACVEAARGNPSGYYVNNTNGGRITTQGYGMYSAVPYPNSRWQMPHPQSYQALIDATPRPAYCPRPEGDCIIETYTVSHGHTITVPVKGENGAGPDLGIVIGRLTATGERFIANTACSYNEKGRVISKPGPLEQLMTEDGWIGGTGTVTIDETGRNIVTLGERNPQRP